MLEIQTIKKQVYFQLAVFYLLFFNGLEVSIRKNYLKLLIKIALLAVIPREQTMSLSPDQSKE